MKMSDRIGLSRAAMLAVALCLMPGLSAGREAGDSPEVARAAEIVRAADFEYEDINPQSATHGQRLKLDRLSGDGGLVLNFLASWCPPCWAEVEDLMHVSGAVDVPVVCIAADEHGPPDDLLRLAGEAGLTLPLLLVPKERIDWMTERYDHAMLPATYVIDESQQIREVLLGRVRRPQLLEALKRVGD